MKSFSMKELFVGQSVEKEFLITEEIGRAFAKVSQDENPLHLREDYAKKTPFGRRIAHGMLLGSYISAMLGMELPGEGTIYMKQELTFLKPVYYGDTIRVKIEVTKLEPEKKRAVLSTSCYSPKSEPVLAGSAQVRTREE